MVKLKPAIIAYNVSDVATPRPEMNPDFQFLLRVLFIQSMPSGPNGTETTIPMIMPSRNECKPIQAKLAENIIHVYFRG